MQQRGVSTDVVELILEYGKTFRTKDKAQICLIPPKSRKKLREDIPRETYSSIEKKLDVAIVMIDDRIVTVEHRYRHIVRQ
jgi:hypothetical protein